MAKKRDQLLVLKSIDITEKCSLDESQKTDYQPFDIKFKEGVPIPPKVMTSLFGGTTKKLEDKRISWDAPLKEDNPVVGQLKYWKIQLLQLWNGDRTSIGPSPFDLMMERRKAQQT